MRDLIIGAASGTIIYWAGFYRGRKNRPTPEEKDLSICSCTHAYSSHSDKGRCQALIFKKLNGLTQKFNCACVRYDGVPPAHIYMKDA